MTARRQRNLRAWALFACVGGLLVPSAGCRSARAHRDAADRAAAQRLTAAQQAGLGRSETIGIESAADTLRRRLLLGQELPRRGAASLGLRDLPATATWDPQSHLATRLAQAAEVSLPEDWQLGLLDALQVMARNNREYQEAKEDLFRAALALDLEADRFRETFSGLLSGSVDRDGSGEEDVESARGSAIVGVSKRFLNGVEVSGRIAVDLAKLLTQEMSSSLGLLADASISIPLLRGAGRRVAGESLTQAERDLLYAVYTFEEFKRGLAVRVAAAYLGVLREQRQVLNAEENYRRLIVAARRSRRLADAGRLPEFQYDQAVQDELRARTRWIAARQSYASREDAFKLLLGLPPDARLALDEREIARLGEAAMRRHAAIDAARPAEAEPGPGDDATAPAGPDPAFAGPLDLEPARAIRLALDARLDLRVAEGAVEDAQRKVYIAADALRAELTLLGRAEVGSRRSSASSASLPDAELRPSDGTLGGLLTLDLPLERTAERNAYRVSLIALERAVRAYQAQEDRVKLDVLDALRALAESREAVGTQRAALALAEKRVRSTEIFLQAGRAQVRDVLESQEALLNAQNAWIAAVVDHRVAELTVQRQLGRLEVRATGLWTEYEPEEPAP